MQPTKDRLEIRRAIEDWGLVALGNRPEDYLIRDTLLASALRDRRPVWFHDMISRPPLWIGERVAHLPPKHRQQAIELTALEFMHRWQLGRLWEDRIRSGQVPDPEYDEAGEGFKLLLSLGRCRPVGALLEWRGREPRPHDYTCRYSRACPWCHARRVRRLYDRLMDGPCRPDRLAGQHLVRLRLLISNRDLARQAGFVACAAKHGVDMERRSRAWGANRWLHEIEVKLSRAFFGGLLRRRLDPWHPAGGLITHQVGPALNHSREGEFRIDYHHELNLLAIVSFATEGHRMAYRNAMGIGIPGRMPLIEIDRLECAVIQAADAPADHPQALRRLLVGTPPRGRHEAGGIATNLQRGRVMDGAMRQLPWFLADPNQWWSHVEATRRARQFAPFGTWLEQLRDAKESPAAGDRRRSRAFAAHNHENRIEAARRREALLGVARPVYERLSARPGRRPGRPALMTAMAEAGHPISDKVAKDLIRKLRVGSGEEP